MSKLSVSIATFAIRRYDTLAALEAHVEEVVDEAKRGGARVVLLPEMGNVGLLWSEPTSVDVPVREIGATYGTVLTPFFAPFRAAMQRIAKAHDVVLVGPTFWHRTDGVGTNSALVFMPDGREYRQDKIHPTRPEMAIDTTGGDALVSFEIDGIKAAVLICYDVQFPELTRKLVDNGVQMLLVPSLTSRRGYWRVRYASHARAGENQIYVCVSPLFGNLGIPSEYPLQACGGAYVTCPIDNRFGVEDGLLASAPHDEEGILNVELDFDLLQLSRDKGEIRPLKDRRPELYASL